MFQNSNKIMNMVAIEKRYSVKLSCNMMIRMRHCKVKISCAKIRMRCYNDVLGQ